MRQKDRRAVEIVGHGRGIGAHEFFQLRRMLRADPAADLEPAGLETHGQAIFRLQAVRPARRAAARRPRRPWRASRHGAGKAAPRLPRPSAAGPRAASWPSWRRRVLHGAKFPARSSARREKPDFRLRSACRRCAARRDWECRRHRPQRPRPPSWRSWAKKNCGALSAMFLPVRASRAFMPRVSFPEDTRMKAMRSRWFGSMFAWILNTKPVILASRGSTLRVEPPHRLRRRREFGQGVDQILHAEFFQRRAEKHRRQMAFEKGRDIERLLRLTRQLDLLNRRESASAAEEISAIFGSSGPETLIGSASSSSRRTTLARRS